MEPLRCFIAIELPAEVKKGLRELQSRLRAENKAPIKWVEPENIHLTLKFLGNVAASRVGEVSQAVTKAVAGTSPFSLKVEGLGVFPNSKRVQIVWVGVSGELERLAGLQRRIEAAMEGLGFAAENRRFTPHLTLARVRDQATASEREGLGQLVGQTEFDAAGEFRVESVKLMQSQLTREGPIYTALSSAAL
jgi:2'-5' RNA ligase